MNANDHHYMSQALELAGKGRYTVSPNPMVGCVIVNNGELVGLGYHQQAGGPHAEVHALAHAGSKAQGATAYVTLEPCCHHGKTAPCTDALIKSGIARVVVACPDPNPLVAGKGMQQLRQAGIAVDVGILETEAKQLNTIFFHYIIYQRPYVIAKWAMSFDGKTTTNTLDDQRITGVTSQQHTHDIRQQVDAILIGAKTAITDNPQLTARFEPVVKQPSRIIVSSDGDLPLTLKIFQADLPGKTYVATTNQISQNKLKQFQELNIEVLVCEANSLHQVDILSLLTILGKHQITSLLVEGGQSIHHSFFQAELVNKIHVYMAPTIIANTSSKQSLHQVDCNLLDGDYYFSAEIQHV